MNQLFDEVPRTSLIFFKNVATRYQYVWTISSFRSVSNHVDREIISLFREVKSAPCVNYHHCLRNTPKHSALASPTNFYLLAFFAT